MRCRLAVQTLICRCSTSLTVCSHVFIVNDLSYRSLLFKQTT